MFSVALVYTDIQVLQQTWYVQCLFKMAKGCFFTEDPLVPPRRFFLCGILDSTGVQLGNVFSFSLLACSSLALCLLLHRLLSTCVGGDRVQKPYVSKMLCKAFLFHLGLSTTYNASYILRLEVQAIKKNGYGSNLRNWGCRFKVAAY